MIRDFSDVLDTQFSAPINNAKLNLIKYLKKLHPNSQIVPTVVTSDTGFPLSEYIISQQKLPNILLDQSHISFEFDAVKGQQKVFPDVVAGVTTFSYNSVEFRAYKATWLVPFDSTYYFYGFVFDGEDGTVGQQLASEVYKWAHSLKEEIWVFEGGWWAKNKQLYEAISSSDWDEVVLKDEFKDGLRRDTETFFSSKDIYKSLGMTWKRGILLLGPPGNGKTESIKALLNEFKYPALYVKSFTTNYGPEHGVRAIFDHARKHSPCILVLEDLDAMVTPKVRSFFLNELDGLAQNDGILTIATTNHPERIDDAILNRPSRFDVKYNFTLPDLDLRKTFASKWIDKILGLGAAAANGDGVILERKVEDVANDVAEKTDGWSFAFLKELFVSFLLRLAHDSSLRKSKAHAASATNDSAETILMKQIDQLADQIIKVKESDKARQEEEAEEGADENDRWCPPPVEVVNRSHGAPSF